MIIGRDDYLVCNCSKKKRMGSILVEKVGEIEKRTGSFLIISYSHVNGPTFFDSTEEIGKIPSIHSRIIISE
jgi:hypothetical protein